MYNYANIGKKIICLLKYAKNKGMINSQITVQNPLRICEGTEQI